jgi:beta-lactamase class D
MQFLKTTMKTLKYFLLSLFLLSTNIVSAAEPNFQKTFKDKNGCFILYDLQSDKILIKYNPNQCKQRFYACSTFKIPLTLMAFDQGIFQSVNTTIKWDKVERNFAVWNKDQTPKTYLQYSAVWVSQWLTPQIGMEKIKQYLANFRYGNQDMSGGLTKAWLSSTLKISANEQKNFLRRLWQNHLAVSLTALKLTKESIYAEKLPNGDILQGKTGSGFLDGRDDPNTRYIGWFVGYFFHEKKEYIVVTNYVDLKANNNPNLTDRTQFIAKAISAGAQAKIYTEEILKNYFSS